MSQRNLGNGASFTIWQASLGDLRSPATTATFSVDDVTGVVSGVATLSGGRSLSFTAQLNPRQGRSLQQAIADFASTSIDSEFMNATAPMTSRMVTPQLAGIAVLSAQLANGNGVAELADFSIPITCASLN